MRILSLFFAGLTSRVMRAGAVALALYIGSANGRAVNEVVCR